MVPEPLGGSQTDHLAAGNLLRQAVLEALRPLLALPAAHLIRARRSRFRRFGQAAVTTPTDIAPPQPRERHEEKAV